jgi:predicted transcriptional regulator
MEEDILAVEARRKLYEFVRNNPGFHLREIARALDLSITLADYHLRFLEKHELVSASMDGEYKRYYPRSVPGAEDSRPALTDAQKGILAFLRQPVPLRVLAFLMERESASHKEMLERVPVSPSTLSHHLKKMQIAGVLERADGTDRGYKIAEPKTVALLMTMYELATADQVDTFLRVWGEFRV